MNKSIFGSSSTKAPVATTTNAAGGPAYHRTSRESLAQYACTGTFNSTYYVTATDHISRLIPLINIVLQEPDGPSFIGSLAVFSRTSAFMKDMPAYLLSTLYPAHKAHFSHFFPLVIDNGKMLRNLTQILRARTPAVNLSSSTLRRLYSTFLSSRTPSQLLRDSIGNDPSLADILRLVHPRPSTPDLSNIFAFILSRDLPQPTFHLPPEYQALAALRKNQPASTTGIPFQLLTSLTLTSAQWTDIACSMSWTELRMNLNTLQRHGVLDPNATKLADKLGDPQEVIRARAFPYQLLTTYQNIEDSIPQEIRSALHRALEQSTSNVEPLPIPPSTYPLICIDVSGSMSGPITGYRQGSTTKTRCIDVAALVACTLARRHPNAHLIPFDERTYVYRFTPEDSILTNAQDLARYGGGGTNCSLALSQAVSQKLKPSAIIYISDNESWMDHRSYNRLSTSLHELHRRHYPKTPLILIDLTPNTTTQAQTSPYVLNIGGFSDNVWPLINQFISEPTRHSFTSLIPMLDIPRPSH